MVESIDVTYTLAGVADDDRPTVERVLAFHAERCPGARSIEGSIDIRTHLTYVE